MDTLCSKFDRSIYSIKDNEELADGLKKYTKLILSDYTDETIKNFEKLSITNINREISRNKNNKHFNDVVSNPIECKNNMDKQQNNDALENDNRILNRSKRTLNTFDGTRMHNKQNVLPKFSNKKQRNISFSKEKLWEINRVNQILHRKISSAIKPTHVVRSPTVLMKATSTINREKKKNDIIKGNKVSIHLDT